MRILGVFAGALVAAAFAVWISMRDPLAGLLIVGIALMLPQLVRWRSEG